MRKLRYIMLLTLIFVLSFSTTALGQNFSPTNSDEITTVQGEQSKIRVSEKLDKYKNPKKKVRIVVELQGPTTVEQAKKKGVKYKKMHPSERKKLEASVIVEQKNVQASIKSSSPSIHYLENFTTIFNGFSAEVATEEVAKIAATSGVKTIYESTEYERPEVKPDMKYSKELVQSQRAWNEYNFRGEGMVVAVIDTGIDPTHQDMILSDETPAKLTNTEVNELLTNGTIQNGQYFTAKIPFGYNYMDGNYDVIDSGTMHGMHVSGIVAANGAEENGGIKGVAPEAQLLALKVFGNDLTNTSSYSDVYVKAIDDAIKLDADVINMSLGTPAGFVDDNSPEQLAVQRAIDDGVMVVTSSGNSDMYGSGYRYPYAENQDYGVTGTPNVSKNSMGVASFENSTVTSYGFSIHIDDVPSGEALYLLANEANPMDLYSGEVEVLDAEYGAIDEFSGKDFNGKIALASRGKVSLVEIALNAQAAGAIGVIIYNNTPGIINMLSDPAIKIPYMAILQSDGLAIKAALKEQKPVTISFDGAILHTPSLTAGKMSAFTSWGPTPNLDFKPEITAPGGNIFSTLNNNQYGIMSGTSMAAPHVAGGSTLILQRISEEFNVSGAEAVLLTKNLLMNTASPIEFQQGQYVSPRRQGAGLMQLANALVTDVIVTNKETNEAKVALKEIANNQFTFTLVAKNFSNEEKTFVVNTQIQVDTPLNAQNGIFVNAPNLYGQIVLTKEDIAINSPEKITIPANGTVNIPVSVDLSSIAEQLTAFYPNGFFVDGYVTLTDPNEDITGNVPLSVPFFGFNGEWDRAPIFDYFAWEPKTFWGYTALADEQGNFITGGGTFDSTRFGFSPNNDGVRDYAIPVFSLFRNAKELKVEVLDSKGEVIQTVRNTNNVAKNYSLATPYTFIPENGWDGRVNNKVAKDGDYFLQVSGVIDYAGADWQSIRFPVKVDTTAPKATVELNDNKTILLSNIDDGDVGTGIEYWQVYVNNVAVSDQLSKETVSFTLPNSLTKKDVVNVRLIDAAMNQSEYILKTSKPNNGNGNGSGNGNGNGKGSSNGNGNGNGPVKNNSK
ncbi:lactocepin [Lysinibacillus composti]|uniref:Lactocepin n=1 Tax=Lysinibacillus composti TaxID=720633 RepID=A0A3N9UFW9_9BACI|nr:S8 family serine peptidase [Lysinibacillus composti]MBM7608298.1 lactocepin [Lysinibacillus composti]RQW75020.1 lactocepin [Lysinibacillus composti]